MEKIKIYVKSVLLPLVLGGLIGFLIRDSMNYSDLVKPALAPPGILFPIVWTILYFLMGISYGILESNDLHTSKTKSIYYLQLVVNLLWPLVFFVLKWRLFAFVWILLLDVLILLLILRFAKKKRSAGLLQIPYFVWTLFATYLNFAIYLLNR